MASVRQLPGGGLIRGRYRKTDGVAADFSVADDSRLQEVLDRAWQAFGDPDAPIFPSAEQVEQGKRILEKWKATQQLKARRRK